LSVHLEGMGLSGALLAHRLAIYGVPFTWHDIDAPITAWKASTGAIYPAGAINHGPDKFCYDVWKSWYEAGQFSAAHLEKSTGFVFCTKNPPHKGDYHHERWAGDHLSMGIPSYHLNGQSFVQAMRDNFAHCRVESGLSELARRDTSRPYIVTHGWGLRLGHAYWGWTRLVELNNPPVALEDGCRPSFYFRPDRFSMAYAYPVPGTNWYYAGSSIIKQKLGRFKELDPVAKYERWKRIFEKHGEGFVTVGKEGPFLTGWRPAAREEDEAWVRVRGRVLTLRPLWNSGIRHFPQQWAGIAPCLGLIA
jgi:hypothetical protein